MSGRWKPSPAQALARELANEMAADTVAEALERDRIQHGRATADYQEISRRVGRAMGRTLHRIIAEQGCTVTTLADVAQALDHTLVVKLMPRTLNYNK
jgi:predicted transposase YdaD